MSINLSQGSLQALLAGETVASPVLQILGCKKIPANGTERERFRLMVSDGSVSISFAMLATQLNEKITSGQLDKLAVIRVENYICNTVQGGKKVMVILDVTVLKKPHEVGSVIGNPIQYDQSNASAARLPLANSSIAKSRSNPGFLSNVKSEPNLNHNKQPRQNAFANRNTAANTSMSSSATIYPLSSLTPYQNRWTIRARVSSKAGIRTYSNSRGEGKLFSCTFLDDSGEIRATGFNAEVDKFYDLLETNKVYYVSNCTVKGADKRFSSVNHDYELTFRGDTMIEVCNEDCSDLPQLQFDFKPIAELKNATKEDIVDVIGICKSCGDVQTIMTRQTQREVKKRDIMLIDQSNAEVSMTLWGNEAENFDGSASPVVAIKGARVSDFGGVSLSSVSSSTIYINPEVKESFILQGWYEKEGANAQPELLSVRGSGSFAGSNDWKCLGQIEIENLGSGDKADFFMCKSTIVLLKKENIMYRACPTPSCNKKVVDLNDGTYRCEKCNIEGPDSKWRLLLNMNIADFSGNKWVTCYHEGAEQILGATSEEMGHLQSVDEEKFNAKIAEATFSTYCFKMRCKAEVFNDENRIRVSIASVSPINYLEHAKKLLAELSED